MWRHINTEYATTYSKNPAKGTQSISDQKQFCPDFTNHQNSAANKKKIDATISIGWEILCLRDLVNIDPVLQYYNWGEL